jgi:hypothetical protein
MVEPTTMTKEAKTNKYTIMTKKTNDTVFTNSDYGIFLQKAWLLEFNDGVIENYNEKEHDYILVSPDGNSGLAATMFMKLNSDILSKGEIRNRIHGYVSKNKKQGKVLVLFLNYEERINYYSMYGLIPKT